MATPFLAMQLFAAPQPPPVASISEDKVRIVLPTHVLDHAAVRKQMASALTTTFVIDARARHSAPPPRSRVEIRLDLWDQVHVARRVEMGRTVDQRRLASMEELRQWWRTPIHVMDAEGPRVTLDVTVIVLPFSAAEEGDARDWLEKSGGIGTEQSPASGVIGAMIGTTIQARPIATFRWTIEAAEERP